MKHKKLPFPYLYAILIGLGVGILWGLRDHLYMVYLKERYDFNYQRFILHCANYITWGLIYPLVYIAIKWARQARVISNVRTIGRLVIIGLGLSFLHEIISNVIVISSFHLLGYEEFSMGSIEYAIKVLPAAIITRMSEFIIIYIIFSALDFQQKLKNKQIELAQLNSQLSSAQLNALRLQLQPHFLFNTLNTISSLIDFNKKQAQKIISQLGNLLRFVLEQKQETQVELRDELAFIKNYLNIEQVRFQDRLRITYEIAQHTLDAHIPSLILQPLVENAIKHGFSKQSGEGHIQVKSYLEKEQVHLIVSDDGNGSALPSSVLLSKGIGLQNVEKRLKLTYQEKAKMQLTTSPDHGFVAHIVLPFQKKKS
jgi:two-component system LytT family sensor kinase